MMPCRMAWRTEVLERAELAVLRKAKTPFEMAVWRWLMEEEARSEAS